MPRQLSRPVFPASFILALAGLAAMPAVMLPVVSAAAASGIDRALSQLDPITRLEQVCDYAAMTQIARDASPYKPDRAVAGAMEPARMEENRLTGKGGAFRSNGQWYRYSFDCVASEDNMQVTSFDYQVGGAIPEEEWEDHGLWR